MAEDRPRNFLQVLTGAAGAGLETLGKAKAAEKQRALPEALSIFSAMLEAERAQEQRALNRIRRKEATIDVEIKGSQLQRILKLQTLGLDNPLELEKALQDIRAEGELEKTRSLMEMVEEETGVTTIPSGLKAMEEPRGPEELGVDAAIREAAKRGKLGELGFPSGVPGEKTLSAKDQWYKSYLGKQYSSEEAAERFAEYVNTETGPMERQEYYQGLHSSVRPGPFGKLPSDEDIERAKQFWTRTTGWLEEYQGKVGDVVRALRTKLDDGKISQEIYDSEISHINDLMGITDVEGQVGAGRP